MCLGLRCRFQLTQIVLQLSDACRERMLLLGVRTLDRAPEHECRAEKNDDQHRKHRDAVVPQQDQQQYRGQGQGRTQAKQRENNPNQRLYYAVLLNQYFFAYQLQALLR